MNYIADFLATKYEQVEPMEFYRSIFPSGVLDDEGAYTKGKFVGIAQEIIRKPDKRKKPIVHRYTITDDLDTIDELIHCDNFCITSPISYIGKTRESKNARVMFALVDEIDDLLVTKRADGSFEQTGILQLERDWTIGRIPKPTYLVASGNGVHLYYLFDKPVYLYKNVIDGLAKYKNELTRRLWSKLITKSWENIQHESLFQGFRMVGTITKNGDRVEAFKVGEPVTLDYLNSIVGFKTAIPEAYASKCTLREAQEKYPEWYERVVVNKDHSKQKWDIAGKVHGDNPKAMYDWWKRMLMNGAIDGNRYHCLWVLVIYAIKLNLDRETIERDCWELLSVLDDRTIHADNRFTEYDVQCALQSFEDRDLFTYPINSIVKKTGIEIEKNKRNYRKQEQHLMYARGIKSLKLELGECTNGGRPSAQEQVMQWCAANPEGTKSQCKADTGLSYPTIRKWWDSQDYDEFTVKTDNIEAFIEENGIAPELPPED